MKVHTPGTSSSRSSGQALRLQKGLALELSQLLDGSPKL